MKVSELIEKLKKMNQDADILTSIDEEGNDFNSVDVIDEDFFTTDGKQIYLCGDEYDEEDAKQCVILWP